MIFLFILFIIAIFFLYRDPKGHNRILFFKTPIQPPKDTLSVMTYNIGFGGGLNGLKGVTYSAKDVQKNLDAMIFSIKKNNPDILCVQEIDIRSKRSFKIDEVEYLAKACGFPYVAVAFTWNRYYIPFPFTLNIKKHFGKVLAGQAIFSKYPITSQIVLPLPKLQSKPWWYRFFYLQHVMQTATIQVGNKNIEIVNLHFEAFDKATRQRQADFAVTEIEDVYKELPVIVAGDFNALETNQESLTFEDEPGVEYGSDQTIGFFRKISFLKCGTENSEGTYPSNNPNRRLDYIFYSPKQFNYLESRRCDEAKTASDHFPVYTNLKLNVEKDSL